MQYTKYVSDDLENIDYIKFDTPIKKINRTRILRKKFKKSSNKEIKKNIKKNINMYNNMYKNSEMSYKNSISMLNLHDTNIFKGEIITPRSLKKCESISNSVDKQYIENTSIS